MCFSIDFLEHKYRSTKMQQKEHHGAGEIQWMWNMGNMLIPLLSGDEEVV